MKRTPIIAVAQVYLHNEYNEYAVVTKVNRGNIHYHGIGGFYGMNEVTFFLDRFSPVDPADLNADEVKSLVALLPQPQELLIGWVTPDDDDGQDNDMDFED